MYLYVYNVCNIYGFYGSYTNETVVERIMQ